MSVIIKSGASGNTANVDGSNNLQVVLASGSHVIADSGSTTVVTGTVAVTESGTWTVRCLGNAGAIFDAPTAASVPANGLYNGVRGTTANPTAVTDGQLVGTMSDKVGRLIVVHNQVRDLAANQITTITSSSAETTVVSSVASTFLDIVGIQITTSTATAHTVTIKDSTGGTSQKIFDIPANGGIVVKFDPPLKQTTVNNNWTATLSSAAVTTHINVDYVKNI